MLGQISMVLDGNEGLEMGFDDKTMFEYCCGMNILIS